MARNELGNDSPRDYVSDDVPGDCVHQFLPSSADDFPRRVCALPHIFRDAEGCFPASTDASTDCASSQSPSEFTRECAAALARRSFIGSRMLLVGLKSSPDLNGRVVHVSDFDRTTGRYRVLLLFSWGVFLDVERENLAPEQLAGPSPPCQGTALSPPLQGTTLSARLTSSSQAPIPLEVPAPSFPTTSPGATISPTGEAGGGGCPPAGDMLRPTVLERTHRPTLSLWRRGQ